MVWSVITEPYNSYSLIKWQLSIGTLMGSLSAGPVADFLGRRLAIVVLNAIFMVGLVVQIATQNTWCQIALGRWVAGLGVGGLSVLTPMYQSETAPRQIRGSLVRFVNCRLGH